MSSILKFIKYAFTKYPIASNSLVYGTLYVGAEFSQQTISRKVLTKTPTSYDTPAIARYAVYGTGIQGPFLTIWYRWLDKKFIGTSYKIVAQKLLLDQFLMTPQILVIFYVAMSIMEKKKDIFEECKQKIIPTFKSSCMFWLPAQTVNFLLIPPSFRVVYVGTCSFAWVNILCWIKRQEY
ncbi:mpv17-like protein isoform X1 [Tribolium castaneum]|uniref:Mpv17-like protein n=1 Tax=Tribolium castaneum TaxID=7070 RepID=A0A139WDG6_TRICA|nr:PREDICTED: mpv17-like protein isoform X1 [Tribolium castaneum]XP_008197039.1 PREDICTED: mpv17-like protein isoform X1 [Tribolium castaneum]KYB25895.1 Mpv17-like protein [Tribolium castaneum]|eukprot:XP_008197038.1 PREDICTED: mpv17-like protein isoform X1 [Tribolium castaneum]